MKQMACIYFIVDALRIPFEGDFNNQGDVKQFIYQHYKRAFKVKEQMRTLEDWADTVILQEAIHQDVEQWMKEPTAEKLESALEKPQPEVINLRALKRRDK